MPEKRTSPRGPALFVYGRVVVVPARGRRIWAYCYRQRVRGPERNVWASRRSKYRASGNEALNSVDLPVWRGPSRKKLRAAASVGRSRKRRYMAGGFRKRTVKASGVFTRFHEIQWRRRVAPRMKAGTM